MICIKFLDQDFKFKKLNQLRIPDLWKQIEAQFIWQGSRRELHYNIIKVSIVASSLKIHSLKAAVNSQLGNQINILIT